MYTLKAKGWSKHLDFIFIDCLCLALSFILATYIRHDGLFMLRNQDYIYLFLVLILLNLVLMVCMNPLNSVLKRGYYIEFARTINHNFMLLLVISAYLFLMKMGVDYSRIVIYLTMVIYTFLTYLARISWKHFLCHSRNIWNEKAILLMGCEKNVIKMLEEIGRSNFHQYKIVGIIMDHSGKVGQSISFGDIENGVEDIPIVADYSTVVEYASKNWVDEILISLNPGEDIPDQALPELMAMGVTLHINLSHNNQIGAKQTVNNIGGLFVITTALNHMTFTQYLMKRGLDIIGGICGCIITGILYPFVALAIRKESPGPIFFAQERIGKNGKPFKMYKFRSMYMDAEARKAELMKENRLSSNLMFKMDFDPRIIGNRIDENGKQITGVGEFIRKYSIDEFPQFYNVLKGEMSLVGTRPPLPAEYQAYSTHHKARLAMVPGITGLWQISGRSDILDFEEVVKLDTEYINNWSPGTDLRILLKTVRVVLKKEGSM